MKTALRTWREDEQPAWTSTLDNLKIVILADINRLLEDATVEK